MSTNEKLFADWRHQKTNTKSLRKVRQQLIDRIKNERLSLSQAAKEAGVHESTVYHWIGRGAESVSVNLELTRLKTREQVTPRASGRTHAQALRNRKRSDRETLVSSRTTRRDNGNVARIPLLREPPKLIA
jgi:transposase